MTIKRDNNAGAGVVGGGDGRWYAMVSLVENGTMTAIHKVLGKSVDNHLNAILWRDYVSEMMWLPS